MGVSIVKWTMPDILKVIAAPPNGKTWKFGILINIKQNRQRRRLESLRALVNYPNPYFAHMNIINCCPYSPNVRNGFALVSVS